MKKTTKKVVKRPAKLVHRSQCVAPEPTVRKTVVKPDNGPPCAVEKTFTHHVDVPDPTPAQAVARKQACVRLDRQQRSALELTRTTDEVSYIAHQEDGLSVMTEPPSAFDGRYGTKVLDYPTGRAARLYVGFATILGGTSEAMAALSTLVHVTTEEREMATKKAATTNIAKHTPVKTSVAAKKVGAKTPRVNGASPAAYFRELIMKGGQPDSKIFAAVKAKHNLDDSKRSYVAWYRNQLKKQGKNPPAAIEA
jgi:hypothetical protein